MLNSHEPRVYCTKQETVFTLNYSECQVGFYKHANSLVSLRSCNFCYSDAVITVQTMTSKGCRYQGTRLCVSLSLCVVEVATQTEAPLISVLESNLACVQNGSLYQLGGSLPRLESGGSKRGSSSSDAFLVTAEREQLEDHLLQRPTVCWGRTQKALFMIFFY